MDGRVVQKAVLTSAPARRTATMQRGSPRLQSPLCAKSEGAGLPLCDSCIHLYPFLPFLTLEIIQQRRQNRKRLSQQVVDYIAISGYLLVKQNILDRVYWDASLRSA
jgi:hypothetical protein